jgi:hypothetical protein
MDATQRPVLGICDVCETLISKNIRDVGQGLEKSFRHFPGRTGRAREFAPDLTQTGRHAGIANGLYNKNAQGFQPTNFGAAAYGWQFALTTYSRKNFVVFNMTPFRITLN